MPAWCKQSIHTAYIGKNDINSSGIPSDDLVEDSLNTPFDVLIDLTYCMHPVFHWIITLSNAYLKIGAGDNKIQQKLDIYIDIPNGKTQEELFSLATQYQNMFQKK